MLILDLGQSGSRFTFNGVTTNVSRGKLQGELVPDSLSQVFNLIPSLTANRVALSCTGFNGVVKNVPEIAELCRKFFNAKEIAVIDDGLAGFIGSLNAIDGVALTIGGGVVAIGGRSGKFSHRDGLGSTFGDEGGGYWLGKLGLTKALAVRQGRADDVSLLENFKDECASFDLLKDKSGAEAATLAINTAKKVLEAADAGIETAIKIVNEGAELLGRTIISAWLGAGGERSESPKIVIKGGPASNQSYVDKIQRFVISELPNAKFMQAAGDNLVGAEWIASNIKRDIPPLLYWASTN